MDLRFLTNREATLELNNSDYLRKMSKSELLVRLSAFYRYDQVGNYTREELQDALSNVYLNSFQDFDSSEQEVLELYFRKIWEQLASNGATQFFFPPNGVGVSLIKVNDHQRKLDWGYLYTLNSSVVIPTSYLEGLVTRCQQFGLSVTDTMGPSSSGLPVVADRNLLLKGMGDLYHEVVHILQRLGMSQNDQRYLAYPKFFGTMYRKFFGFQRVERSQIRGRKRLQEKVVLVTNPDAANFEWITTITVNGRYQAVAPTLVYAQASGRPEEVLFFLDNVEARGGCGGDKTVYYLNGQFLKVNSSDAGAVGYRNRFFGLTGQLHHPNEVSAQLLSDYLVLGKMWGDDWTAFPFYQYIDRWLVTNDF